MKQQEVIRDFVSNIHSCESASHLFAAGGKLFNYGTCIAQHTDRHLIVNITRYSVTTSKIQGWLKRAVSHRSFVKYVMNVPMGASDLARYIKE